MLIVSTMRARMTRIGEFETGVFLDAQVNEVARTIQGDTPPPPRTGISDLGNFFLASVDRSTRCCERYC